MLPGSQAETVVKDCKKFLRRERWYFDRGIPYRRGYLLEGRPGCGKSSLIMALAGELRMPVYVLSLSRAGMCDATLEYLMSVVPKRAIVALEDIDASIELEDPEMLAAEAAAAGTQKQ